MLFLDILNSHFYANTLPVAESTGCGEFFQEARLELTDFILRLIDL